MNLLRESQFSESIQIWEWEFAKPDGVFEPFGQVFFVHMDGVVLDTKPVCCALCNLYDTLANV